MATQAYRTWVDKGEPWRPCRPGADIKAFLVAKLGSVVATQLGMLGNDAHLTADYPQDHCPFSYTKWPVAVSEYVVCALDIMHKPDLGLDCYKLFDYWLAEAKAGRMPWLKYLIWRGTIYDVRNGWRPESNSGHFDHIHLSFRTDFLDKGIGDWSPLPGGDDVSWDEDVIPAPSDAPDYATNKFWMAKNALGDVLAKLRNIYTTGARKADVSAVGAKVDALAAKLDGLAQAPVQIDYGKLAAELLRQLAQH